MEEAGVTAQDIDYVNLHGTSTQLNDRIETRALKLALGEHNTNHELSEYARSGSSLDDHHTVAGYCSTCDLHIVRVYWANGRVEDSLMSTEQRRILAARAENEPGFGRPYSVQHADGEL